MPMYDFECSECGESLELILPHDELDIVRQHEGCGGGLNRLFVNAPKARDKTRYGGMQAVITKGDGGPTVGRVKGHFGREAKLKKR